MIKPENLKKADVGDMTVTRSKSEEYIPPLHKKAKPPPTNKEVINDLLDYSPYGALSQIFIIEAIRSYCKVVMANPMDEKSAAATIISPAAWNGCAKNIHERMAAAYGNPRGSQVETGSGEQDNNNSEGT